MKQKFLIIFILSFMVLCFCSCQKKEISVDYKESFYNSFKIENNKVYIYCSVLIKNPNKDVAKIELSGVFKNDVKNGLLKESLLSGYASDCETTEFNLKNGDNRIEVVFIGNYAGKNQKYDRLLPDINISELQ
ncbi:MAG: hypothetical protein E7389_02265 [Ruminococcaceae bacterium]|nr:hypothetical protein [Oscillospiraceae bacterium]